MDIPTCYDPPIQAAAREARWDAYLSRLPRCSRCGEPILSEKLLYIPDHDEFYCPRCVDAMTEFNQNLEVE